MEKLEKDWIKYPILHLDLNIEKYDTSESLDNILDKSLTAWEKLYGAEPSERSFSLRFAGIIERACKLAGQRVVILVDEYDKPMLQAIGNEELQKQFGIKIDKRHIQVSSPIRSTGLIDVPVKIYQDVTGVINIRVNEGVNTIDRKGFFLWLR